MQSNEGKIVGIDLGTTNSLIAFMEGSEPIIIPNAEGSNKTPSVVAFLDNGEVVVGEIARRQAPTNSNRTVMSIKRLMGRTYSDILESGDILPYRIIGKDDQILIDIGGMGYRPEQLSALILQKLKESAENYLQEPVQQAIVTVPAYFDDLQRNATMEAAHLAGLEVLRLVNEPTAAAMAYGLGKAGEELVAVYDFGGGTFDISILEIDNNAFEVLVSRGDCHLGGDDLDNTLVRWIVEEFYKEQGINLAEDPVTLFRLKEVAEKAKCELSQTSQTLISLPFVAYQASRPLHLEKMITRRFLEDLIHDYVSRTIEICKEAIEQANISKKDISKVILVGGTSRMPLVRDEVEDFFGISPFRGVNPDEIVALGAAAQAGIFSGNLEEVVLLDVTPHPLGVEIKDGRCSTIIEKNSTIPIKAAKTFTTTEDNQAFVNIHVLQGESDQVDDNRSLGKFTLSDIEPAPAGRPRIRITFFINADGVLEISAEDMGSGKEKKLTITHSFLSMEEKESRKKRKRKRTQKSGRRTSSTQPEPGGSILAGIEIKSPIPRDDDGTESRPNPTFNIIEERTGGGPAQHPHPIPAQFPPAQMLPHSAPSPIPPAQVSPQQTSAHAISPLQAVPLQPVPYESLPPVQPSPSAPLPPSSYSQAGISNASTILYPHLGGHVAPVPPAQPAKPLLPEQPAQSRINKTLLEDVRAALSREDVSEAACESYNAFCEHVAGLMSEEAALPSDVCLTLAGVHTMNRFPEEARNMIRKYLTLTNAVADEAVKAYEFLLKYFPEYSLALHDHAILCRDVGRLEDAISELEVIQQAGTMDVTDDLESVYEMYTQGKEDHIVEFKLVKIYLKKNKLDLAVLLLQKLTQNQSYRKKALKILGLTYWQKNMYSMSWNTFRLLESGKELTDILYRLALDVEKVGDLAVAREIYQRILEDSQDYKDVTARSKKLNFRLQLQQKEAAESRPTPILEDSRFVIIEEVNRGSMGVIYKARDKVVGDIVAIKLLNDYLCQDPSAVERFKSEARAAKKLSHPYIVRIHDMFESGKMFFLSMEYIEGTDLKKMITNKIRFSEDIIIQYLLQISDALAYAHSLGIVHRDIKPANIMITPFNTVKITDFGIAKILKTDAITKSGTAVIGTPLYMAPEQITGEGIDARTDIYSLGIMLYEMVEGRPPFCEGNIEYHHVHSNPPPIRNPISEKLHGLIMRMIAKKPENRFQSVQEIFNAIKSAQA